MSYQLVYTSSEQLLSPGLSGYGIVARSAGMPRQLVERLAELCRGHEDVAEPLGCALYTYRVLSCRAEEYHVLSCLRDAGPDYSGRRCHIAHHLALTAEEVQALRRNAARPTPPGLILALQRTGFWLEQWQGEARLLESEPKLTAATLPDASVQQAWKEMSGHKGNARSFYTPPYEQECLVVLPDDTTPGQCLQLLHESDWLSANRGWGRSFCTPGCTDEAGIQRVCIRHAASQKTPLRRGGRAVLRVDHSLELPPATEAPPQGGESATVPPLCGLPYRYVESADEDMFARPAKHRPRRRTAACLAALALLAVGMYFGASDQADELGSAARDTMRHFSARENLGELHNLLAAPYSAETTPARLEQLRARSAAEAADGASALNRCLDTLCLAGSSPGKLAACPAELAACAGELELPQAELLRLALLLATQDRDVAQWQQMLTPEARAAWRETLAAMPQAQAWLANARLAAFVRELLPSAVAKPEPDRADAGPDEAVPPPVAAPLRPRNTTRPGVVSALAGQAAPAALLHALEHAPLELAEGEVIICHWAAERPAATRRFQLGPGGGKLRISPGRRAGEYIIAPSGTLAEDWELRLLVADGVIRALTAAGQPVALRLPLADGEMQAFDILLLPHMSIELQPLSPGRPPLLPAGALQLAEGELSVLHTAHAADRPRLALDREKALLFPWVPAEARLELRQDRFYLPPLADKNRLLPLPLPAGLPYNADVSAEADGSCSVRLRRVYDFSHALHSAFLNMANESCGGRDEVGGAPGSTLAQAYALSLEMESRRNRQQALERYIALFNDGEFAAFMRGVLQPDHPCIPTPAGRHESLAQARSRASSAMASGSTRQAFRQQLRAAITRRLTACYQEEVRRAAHHAGCGLRLVLCRVEPQADGSLDWQFKLEPTPTDGAPQD